MKRACGGPSAKCASRCASRGQRKTGLCPLGGGGVGGKWKSWIWYHLFSGPKRFGELQQLLPQANRQTLTIQLRELEHMGVLHRHAYAQMPPKVEYSLTILGERSASMFRQMYAWGKWCCEQIGVEYDWPVSDEPEERLGWLKGTVTASSFKEMVL